MIRNTLKINTQNSVETIITSQQSSSSLCASSGSNTIYCPNLMMCLPHYTQQKLAFIARLYQYANKQLWLVGGAVRSLLLSKPETIRDFDFVTDATPDEQGVIWNETYDEFINLESTSAVKKQFKKCQLISRKLLITQVSLGNTVYEFSTLKGDTLEAPVAYHNQLLICKFGQTLNEDVLHRDVTINALYYNLQTQEVIDPSNLGISDLKEEKIRKIPNTYLGSDYKRVLRILRLAVTTDFCNEQETEAELKTCIAYLMVCPPEEKYKMMLPETILHELKKMFATDNPLTLFDKFNHYGILDALFKRSELASSEAHDHAFKRQLIKQLSTATLNRRLDDFTKDWIEDLLLLTALLFPSENEIIIAKQQGIKGIEDLLKEIISKNQPFFYMTKRMMAKSYLHIMTALLHDNFVPLSSYYERVMHTILKSAALDYSWKAITFRPSSKSKLPFKPKPIPYCFFYKPQYMAKECYNQHYSLAYRPVK